MASPNGNRLKGRHRAAGCRGKVTTRESELTKYPGNPPLQVLCPVGPSPSASSGAGLCFLGRARPVLFLSVPSPPPNASKLLACCARGHRQDCLPPSAPLLLHLISAHGLLQGACTQLSVLPTRSSPRRLDFLPPGPARPGTHSRLGHRKLHPRSLCVPLIF